MANPSTLQYIRLDYQSQKDALLQRIRARWPSAWNDFLANSIGIVLVDIVAWALATMAFVINRVGAENYISTMTLRESAVRIGSLTGYQLGGPTPATVSCETTLSSAQTADVTIAQGTLIRTSDTSATPFEVLQDYTIMAGALTPVAVVAIFSPTASGANVVNSFFSVTNGSVNASIVDTSVDLSQYISVGQVFTQINGGDGTVYTIQSLETTPASASAFTQIVLDNPWTGATGLISAQVNDLRIALIQGQTVTELYTAPSGNTASFSVKLTQTPVISGSISVTVNGTLWTSVNTTGLYGSFDTVYQIQTLTNGSTVIIFGDGSLGEAVPPDCAISVTYRVGGGTIGNIPLNTINTSVTGLVESLNSPVSVNVTNQTSVGVGGQIAETLDQARVNIPVNARTNDRAVTLQDYQVLAQQYSDPVNGAVAYALSTTNAQNGFLEGNIVIIYAWTVGAGGGLVNLTPPLSLALQTYLQSRAVGTDLVQIYNGTSTPVPISLRFLTLAGYTISGVESSLVTTIDNFVNALTPGQSVIFSYLFNALDATTGVDTINMATPLGDLTPANSMQLFTVPQDSLVYTISRTGSGSPQVDGNGETVSNYTAQLPIFPLSVWSFTLSLGINQLTVIPDVTPGFARILGANISSDTVDEQFWSQVNLLTGQINLWIEGAPGNLTMQLITVQGYSSERVVNLYIAFTGDDSVNTRSVIRSNLQAYSNGLQIGGTLYAVPVSGVTGSSVSIQDVVANVPGVVSVTRVALDSAANTETNVTAADYQLLKIGNIYINNQIN